jgi:hypothetical protein
MSERGDARLERGLRDLLRDRTPVSAPDGLRDRVDRIPETDRAGSGQALRSISTLVALAAVIVVAVIAGQSFRVPTSVGPAASPVPTASFDPSLQGPGVAQVANTAPYWAFVLIVGALCMIFAMAMESRLRIVPAVAAGLLLGWALIGTYWPVQVGSFFYGPGLGVVQAEMPPAVDLVQFYVLASPDEPFSVGVGIEGDPGPVPVRLEGIVGMPEGFIGPRWTAVWLDADTNGGGGSQGPGTPFRPFVLNGMFQGIWLVGRAGQCAVGPSFDQGAPTADGGYASPSITLRLTVLGWPRTYDLAQPTVTEPDTNCLAEPTSTPTPAAPSTSLAP